MGKRDDRFYLEDNQLWDRLKKRDKQHGVVPVVDSLNGFKRRVKKTPVALETKKQNSLEQLLHKFIDALPNPDLNKLRLTKFKLHVVRINRKQLKISMAVFAVLLVGAIGTKFTVFRDKSKDATGVLSDKTNQPDFDTVLPDGKEAETDGGKIAYDSEKKVVSFRDTIALVPVTVSEQTLPESFKEDTQAKVENLAKSFNANEVINESTPKAYLGTSIKGPQTAIFHKNGLLIFIQSESKIDKNDWAAYITTLL